MKKIALLFAVTAAVAAAAIACGDIKPPMDPSALGSASAMPGAPEAPAAPSGAAAQLLDRSAGHYRLTSSRAATNGAKIATCPGRSDSGSPSTDMANIVP